jgi:hypothetical protein
MPQRKPSWRAQPRIPALGIDDHLGASGMSLGRQYAEGLLLLDASDRAGFHGYHLAAHHGTPNGLAPFPQPVPGGRGATNRKLRLTPMSCC